jgi:hypothetical protein
MNYTKPQEWQENVNDAPDTREFGYLLDKFEELRSNPLERSEQVATNPPTDFVSGLGITSKAIELGIRQYRSQAQYTGTSLVDLERMVRLELIKELVSIARTFTRATIPLDNKADMTYQQQAAAVLLVSTHATEVEDGAIEEGTIGGARAKRKSTASVEDQPPSKYKTAQDLKVEGRIQQQGKAPESDPILSSIPPSTSCSPPSRQSPPSPSGSS